MRRRRREAEPVEVILQDGTYQARELELLIPEETKAALDGNTSSLGCRNDE